MMWLLAAAVGVAALGVAGTFGAKRRTRELRGRLERSRRESRAGTFRTQELPELPPPVHRYLRAALKDGQPWVSAVRMKHSGTFDMGANAPNWKPFTSDQRVVLDRPGFDWEARMAMMPGCPVVVHDAYVDGEGILHGAVWGVLPVVNRRGTPELAEGELMRFLAEAAWYPTALVPGRGVEWRAADERSAIATLRDGSVAVTLRFHFDADGLIETVSAEARGRTVGRSVVPTPWRGRFWNYEPRDGMYVPRNGEVEWILPEGPRPYWRGHLWDIQFEFAR